MHKFTIFLFTLSAVVGLSASAHASEIDGLITEIWSSPNSSLVMFKVDDTSSDRHRCNTADRFSIDLASPGGRHTLDLVIKAKELQWPVTVTTLNTCNQYDAENVRHIIFHT